MDTDTARAARMEAAYARLDKAADAESQAILWCLAAKGALDEVRVAREAHLVAVRAELAQAKLEWDELH